MQDKYWQVMTWGNDSALPEWAHLIAIQLGQDSGHGKHDQQ